MKKKRFFIIFIVIIILIVSSFIMGILYSNMKNDLVSVPCANNTLERRTQIKNKDVTTILIPKSSISSNMIIDSSNIIGKYVSSNKSINEKSFFFINDIDDINIMDDGIYFELNDNETIYELFTNNVSVNASHIKNNMYVDLYLTINKPEIKSELIISGVRVCGLYDSNYNEYNSDNKKNNLAIISLVVSDECIAYLNKACILGDISIVASNNPYIKKELFINKKGELFDLIK